MPFRKQLLTPITLLLAAAILVSIVSAFYYDPSGLLKKLDGQMNGALALTATAAGTATVLAAIPDDSTTPIADQIADVASYMAAACTAIMLEKFIAAVAGDVSLLGLIPVGLAVILAARLLRRRNLRLLGRRILIAGLALLLLIPASLRFNSQIDRVLETQQLEEACSNLTEGIRFNVLDVAGSVVDSLTGVLNRLLTLVAVKLLTCIVVPILCLMILLAILKWAMQGLAEFLPDPPDRPRLPRREERPTEE